MLQPSLYGLCRQTVTVYHPAETGYVRTVYPKAYFELRRSRSLDYSQNQSLSRIGPKETSAFLLVIPGGVQAVCPGDKVLLGVGPEISDPEAWAAFIPSRVPGLAVVTWAEPKFWNGQMTHTEAGD